MLVFVYTLMYMEYVGWKTENKFKSYILNYYSYILNYYKRTFIHNWFQTTIWNSTKMNFLNISNNLPASNICLNSNDHYEAILTIWGTSVFTIFFYDNGCWKMQYLLNVHWINKVKCSNCFNFTSKLSLIKTIFNYSSKHVTAYVIWNIESYNQITSYDVFFIYFRNCCHSFFKLHTFS